MFSWEFHFAPLGLVTTILERMGLGVTYSYEDLVFNLA